jgi:N6-adenosine-specific RNA methylase IME4
MVTPGSICATEVPAADDCVLALWTTVPNLAAALQAMTAWGFVYRSNFVWVKSESSTGYCNREKHELLLIGVRGNVPAPALGEEYSSVLGAEADKKSGQPMGIVDIVQAIFPNVSRIGLFAEGRRQGWDEWGKTLQWQNRRAFTVVTTSSH